MRIGFNNVISNFSNDQTKVNSQPIEGPRLQTLQQDTVYFKGSKEDISIKFIKKASEGSITGLENLSWMVNNNKPINMNVLREAIKSKKTLDPFKEALQDLKKIIESKKTA